MTKLPKIAVIGSANVDFVIQTKTLPRAGETVGNGRFFTVPGGKGANQALAARRLGADVSFHACVGDDDFSAIALSNLRAESVNLDAVIFKSNCATGAAFINVADDGENQIAVASGANAAFQAGDVHRIDADVVIAQLEIAEETILAGVSGGDQFFCLNAAPAMPISETLIRRAQLLIVNEIEADFYADQLRSFEGMLAKTYGAKGAAIFKHGNQIAAAEPPSVSVVDTTGAGDTFSGALCVALAEGQSEQAALEFACAAGAIATTKLGAQSGMPSRAEVEAALRR